MTGLDYFTLGRNRFLFGTPLVAAEYRTTTKSFPTDKACLKGITISRLHPPPPLRIKLFSRRYCSYNFIWGSRVHDLRKFNHNCSEQFSRKSPLYFLQPVWRALFFLEEGARIFIFTGTSTCEERTVGCLVKKIKMRPWCSRLASKVYAR